MAAALVFQDHFTLDDMEVHHRDELPTALAAPLFDWGSIIIAYRVDGVSP